jgi:hypothetical protein
MSRRAKKKATPPQRNVLESIHTFVSAIELPAPGPWYEGMWMKKITQLYAHCTLLLDALKQIDGGIRKCDKRENKMLWETYIYIYDILRKMGRDSMKVYPAHDEISDTPLYRLYLVTTKILVSLVKRRVRIGEYVNSPIGSIPYCMSNMLAMTDVNLPISLYTMNDLIMSIKKVDSMFRVLPGSKDLVEYILALEIRAAFFVCSAYTEKFHDIKENTITISSGVFGCKDSVVFDFAFSFLGFKRELNSLRLEYRPAEPIIEKILEDEVDAVCQALHKEAKVIDMSETDAAIRNRYRDDIVPPRLGYAYLAAYPSCLAVSGSEVYAWQKDSEKWFEICSISDMPVEDIFKPTNYDEESDARDLRDPPLMRRAVFYILNILVKRYTTLTIDDVAIGHAGLAMMDDDKMDKLVKDSNSFPYLVFSYNDAGIFWKEELHTFGCAPRSYIIAIWAWIKIIYMFHDNCKKEPREISFQALSEYFIGDFMKKKSSSSSSSSFACSSHSQYGDYLKINLQ